MTRRACLQEDLHPALKQIEVTPRRTTSTVLSDPAPSFDIEPPEEEEEEEEEDHEESIDFAQLFGLTEEQTISTDMEWLGLWGKDDERVPLMKARYAKPFTKPPTPGEGMRLLFRTAWAKSKVCMAWVSGFVAVVGTRARAQLRVTPPNPNRQKQLL